MDSTDQNTKITLLVSAEDFFSEILTQAFEAKKIAPPAPIKNYLVALLHHYLDSKNLFEEENLDELGRRKPQTLAEMYMVALQSDLPARVDLLKKLADKSLYISGFFSDSLQGRVIDIDYYIEMGGTAYAYLAESTREDSVARIYKHFSHRFLDFVEVLSILSQRAQLQSNQNILRIYDRYMKTGSAIDRDKLVQIGILNQEVDQKKKIQAV